jgi:UDP-glucose 4-epimerase
MTRSRSPIEFVPYDRAYEAGFEDMPRRVPDIAKIRAFIGFRPTATLDDILRSVIDYQRAQYEIAPTQGVVRRVAS